MRSLSWSKQLPGLVLATCCACSGDDAADANDASDTSGTPVSDASAGEPLSALPSTFFAPVTAAFTARDDAARTLQVSASGEALGQRGYRYSSTPADGEQVFVDGWDVEFERYFVVIDTVRVNEPGADPDKRENLGRKVVEQRGPWVVDLHKAGPLVGAGGAPETAVPLTVLKADFDTSRTYAFSYETAAASFNVRNTNLREADRDALLMMIEHGWVKYVEGEATYRGRTPSESVDASFQAYPKRVHFAFGLTDAASYVNCHNPEIGEEDEPKNRGVRPKADGAVRAQLTFHTDHMFWDQADVEGAALRFDALAARAQNFGEDSGAVHELTLDDLADVSPSALEDRNGQPVRDRADQTEGYEPGIVAPPVYGTQGNDDITDLRSFIAYNNRAQGHLNSDGLCAVAPKPLPVF
ncbi:MAG: hypothetical protein RL701_2616 [Pseudomonadota bacterium]